MKKWPAKPLKKLVEIKYGDSLPDRLRVSHGNVPVFGSNGIVGRHDKAITRSPVIIIGRKGSIGALNFSGEPCWPIDTAYYIDDFPKETSAEWIYFFLHTQCLSHMKQDGPKAGIRRDDIYEIGVPIPPPTEQRRIVARVESLTSRSQKLRELNASLVEDMTRLLCAEYKRITEHAPIKPFNDVAKLVRRWVKTKPDQNYPETGIRSFGKGTFHKPALTGEQLGTKRICRIKTGDLVFMNVFAWEGAIAVAQPEDDGRVASHRFMTHEVLPDQATAEFLCYYFLTERGLEQIRGASPGSAGRNRTLGITKLEKIPVLVPPIEDQRRFAKLRKLHFQLQRLHREAEAALASFTPALLAKAFRGEL
jgi:type I restriction enzyme S subunit